MNKLTAAIVWLATTIACAIMLYGETQNKRAPAGLDRGLSLVYAAVLLWYLVCSGSSIGQLPEFTGFRHRGFRYRLRDRRNPVLEKCVRSKSEHPHLC